MLGVIEGHWKIMAPFDRSHTYSIVAVTISCTVFKIKRDIGQKTQFFSHPFVFNLHEPLEPFKFLPEFLTQTVRILELLDGARIFPKSSSLCLGCNQRYRRQTDICLCHMTFG